MSGLDPKLYAATGVLAYYYVLQSASRMEDKPVSSETNVDVLIAELMEACGPFGGIYQRCADAIAAMKTERDNLSRALVDARREYDADLAAMKAEVERLKALARKQTNCLELEAKINDKAEDRLATAREALEGAQGLAKLAEKLTGCRADDDYVWGIRDKIDAALAAIGELLPPPPKED